MFKTKKSWLLLSFAFFAVLAIFCLSTKLQSIYDLAYSKSSNVHILKQGDKIFIEGSFANKEGEKQTVEKFKMFNDVVEEGKISINLQIDPKSDRWHDVMQNTAYYFSKNLENGELIFANNILRVKGFTLSNLAKEDLLAQIERLKGKGIETLAELSLIDPQNTVQKLKQELYELLRSKTVEFETEGSAIREESYPLLDLVVAKLKTSPEVKVIIEGNTDDMGEDEFNQKLSEDRAVSIKEYFISQGIDGVRIETIGYGEYRPAFPNDSDENRQKNRRVEFKIKGE